MPHHNIVFHDLLKLLPWGTFDKLVDKHKADADARGLRSKSHLIALLYGQLSGASSLREIVCCLESQSVALYHVGGKAVKRSTLADANRTQPSSLFSDLLAAMMAGAHRRLRQDMTECVYLIDSTSVSLNQLSVAWARYSEGVCGAKVHIIYDPAADCPIHAVVTPSRVNDITAAKKMPIQPGATYVFDLGYYDYGWWQEMHAAGCRIVTRFKSNTPLKVESERGIPGGPILSDRVGTLPKRQARNRKNPFSDQVREVRVQIDTGKVLRILTNDLDASAQKIADLYKRRWAIELFFRWIKQTLKIRKFIGTSENAVRIQVAVALISFLLLRLAQKALKTDENDLTPLAFSRIVRANLMQRRRLDELHRSLKKPPANQNQMEFAFAA